MSEVIISDEVCIRWMQFIDKQDVDFVLFRDHFKAHPNAKILVVGAHDEPSAGILSHMGFDVYGIDLREHDKRLSLCNYKHIIGDFCDMPSSFVREHTGTFDVVVALSCIEHFGMNTYKEGKAHPYYDIIGMRKVWDYLKVGGIAYLTVPIGGAYYECWPNWRVYDHDALKSRLIQDFETMFIQSASAGKWVEKDNRVSKFEDVKATEEEKKHQTPSPHVSTLLVLKKGNINRVTPTTNSSERLMSIVINKQSGQRMIELGCGDKRHPQADVAVDIRPGPLVDFAMNLEELFPISSDEWDCVLSQYAMEHVSYRRIPQFVSEVFRILKPNGTVIIIVPNTDAQLTWIATHLDGWDDKDLFNSASCILYGDQDYPDNTHKTFLTPAIMESLFKNAGFENIQVRPHGERDTDMSLVARKPLDKNPVVSGNGDWHGEYVGPTRNTDVQDAQVALARQSTGITKDDVHSEFANISKVPREVLFGRDYFNGGQKYGGYANEGYRDFACHFLTAQHILARQPSSVLELAPARGYVLKRIQDAGVQGYGYEISKHCFMTRACEQLYNFDVLSNKWHFGNKEVDLCTSTAFLEHVPEEHLDFLLEEHARVAKRGFHGIDFGDADSGWDKTHCLLKNKQWWEKRFKVHGIDAEIVDKEEMEKGEYAPEFAHGDGKLKVQIGSNIHMFHYGWINLDIQPLQEFAQHNSYQFLQHDIRQGLPFETGSVHAIFMSHVLEHYGYREAVALLRECRRVLNSDGVMRLSVPNAFLLINKYRDNMLKDYEEINDNLENLPTELAKLHELLYSDHKAVYDEQTLSSVVEEAGFHFFDSCFRDSRFEDEKFRQMRRETVDGLPCLSLYAYAIPKT